MSRPRSREQRGNFDQLKKFPDQSVYLICVHPPFNSNPDYEVFWVEKRERDFFLELPLINARRQAHII